MKTTLPPLLLLGLLALSARAIEPNDQLPPAPDGKSLKLIWHDEFEGHNLDETKWTYRPDGKETWRSKSGGVCQVPQYIEDLMLEPPSGLRK